MRRQKHGHTLAYSGWKTVKPLSHALCNSLQKEGLKVPISSNLQFKVIPLEVRNCFLERVDVAAHDNRGVLRGHDHPNQFVGASCRFLCYVSDERRRETHPRHDVKGWPLGMLSIQLLRESRGLLACDPDQRRATNQCVAPPEFGDDLRAGLSSTIDPFDICRDIVERGWRAIGHQYYTYL